MPGVHRSAPLELVVIVASAGGISPTRTILSRLATDLPCPVIIMQHHRYQERPDGLAPLYRATGPLPVRMLAEGDLLTPGVGLVPGQHTARITGARTVHVERAHSRPADELLLTAAEELGPGVLAVVLSGRLDDGAEGVKHVKRHGGRAIVQDPTTAESPSMPLHALATGCVDLALRPEVIGSALVSFAMAPGASDMFAVPTPPWANTSPRSV